MSMSVGRPAGFAGWRRSIGASIAAAAGLFGADGVAAQTLGRAGDDDISLWRVGSALLLCCVLGVAAAFALRSRAGIAQWLPLAGTRSRRLRLVETLRLGRQVSLSIVACDDVELLVLSSEQTGELVRRLPFASEPAASGRKDVA